MTRTDPVEFLLHGRRAWMSVIRNDGYCWGVCTIGSLEFDVEPSLDVYEEPDDVAAAELIAMACRDDGGSRTGPSAQARAQRMLERIARYGSHRLKVAVRRAGDHTPVHALTVVRALQRTLRRGRQEAALATRHVRRAT